MSLLSIQGLCLSIHGLEILKHISLDIQEGMSFGLVGESGSGKSMTALSVMALLPTGSSRSGSIMFGEANLSLLSEKDMCRIRGQNIGMIFQEPMTALNPVKTIGHQVAETLIQHGRMRRKEAISVAREKLERVELPTSKFPMSLYPHELSGGQRQRVCIALAIALQPKLLIADEPTTALDVSTQAQILKLLRSLVEEDGMSLLLITHDLAVIAEMTENAAVMQHGRIVEHDNTEQLFRGMQHSYTKRLFAACRYQQSRSPKISSKTLLEVSAAVREYRLKRTRLFEKTKRHRVVDEVSFKLWRGESLGLVGESGCGKSTLARAILGLEQLQGGRVTLDGEAVLPGAKTPVVVRRKMQVVFQDPYGSFNPRQKVERLIAEPFFLIGNPYRSEERQDLVASALQEVGLKTSDMKKYIHEFSGGQRQRIAIARALVLRPSLIVLDEAVSALDVSIRAQILDLLASLQESLGLSYLFISHDLAVVQAVTDRVLVMRSGRIVETGNTAEVFNRPQHQYTKLLIDASPHIPDDWRPIDEMAAK